MKTLFIFITAIMITGLHACDIINPSEQIPSYIHIDSITLKTNYDSFGSGSYQISDAWIIVDNEYIGAYELPATIPVLKEGPHTLYIRAGIRENGVSNTRIPYPFYTPVVINKTFIPAEIDTINPCVFYSGDKLNVALFEDFESGVYRLTKTDRSSVDVSVTDKDVFEGSFSMEAVLKKKSELLEVWTGDVFNIPRGKACFLEMNFKTSNAVGVGYFSINSTESVQHTVITLNPTSIWKKIYINLGTELIFEPAGNRFRLFMGSLKTDDGDSSVILLDNIKLLYFE